jgi:hypothetical protein
MQSTVEWSFDKLDPDLTHLSQNQQREFGVILKKFLRNFANDLGSLGNCKIQHFRQIIKIKNFYCYRFESGLLPIKDAPRFD